jgi:hypothetical protein
MIRVEFKNTAEVARALKEYGAAAERAIGMAVDATGLEVSSDIKKRILRGPKTGRVYTHLFRTINGVPVPIAERAGNNLSPSHQASAPGEAPATDTGRLASSVMFRRTGKLDCEVSSAAGYAQYLEFGTQRIAPRPAWTPAAEQAKPKFVERVAKAIAGLSK